MSLVKKLKAMLNNPGCVRETSKFICPSEMDKVLKVIESMGKDESSVKVKGILTQLIYWIEKLEKDMDIIKGDTLRTILADITSIKTQLIIMGKEAHDLRAHRCEDYKYLPETQFVAQTKEIIKKINKTKEKKDDNK